MLYSLKFNRFDASYCTATSLFDVKRKKYAVYIWRQMQETLHWDAITISHSQATIVLSWTDVVGVVISGRMNDAMKQGCWPLALAVEVMPGKEDAIRVAKVRTKDGEYMWPFAKLYKLQENTLTDNGDGAAAVMTDNGGDWHGWVR